MYHVYVCMCMHHVYACTCMCQEMKIVLMKTCIMFYFFSLGSNIIYVHHH